VRNVAHNPALLGHRVALVTALGHDGSGGETVATLCSPGCWCRRI